MLALSTLSTLVCCLVVIIPAALSSEVQCIKYDTSARAGNETFETCEDRSEDGVPELFCYSVWQNVKIPNSAHSSGQMVHMQGCITSVLGLKDYTVCRQEECVATTSMAEDDNRMLFCCCNTTSCNHQFAWKPKEVSTTTDQPDGKPAAKQNMMTYILGCVGVVSLISIVLLVVCLMLQHRSRGPFGQETKKNKKIVMPVAKGHHLIFSPKEEKEKAQGRLEALLDA